MPFQLNRELLPGNPTAGYVWEHLVYHQFTSKGGIWQLHKGRLGLGFIGTLPCWMDIQFTDWILDPEQMTGDFTFNGFYLTAAFRLMYSLGEFYFEVQLIPSGLLFFVGATFFVVLSPITGVGRYEESLFLSEILQEVR